MILIPAGLAALVTLYCLVCVAHAGWRVREGRVGGGAGIDLGHAVMGATTVAMLLDGLPARWVPVAFGLFGLAVLGCTVRTLRSGAGRLRYLRLGVLSAAMLPMLVPASAGAAPTRQSTMHQSTMHPMTTGTTAMSSTTAASPGRVIDLVLIAALLAVTAARLAGLSRTAQSLHCHLHAMGDVAMAATTGCMLATML